MYCTIANRCQHNCSQKNISYHKKGGHYLQTVSYAKVQLNDKAVGHTELGTTERMIGLLCAVIQVTSYNL